MGTHALIWGLQLSGLFRVHVIMTAALTAAAPRALSSWREGGDGQSTSRAHGKPKVGEDGDGRPGGLGRTDPVLLGDQTCEVGPPPLPPPTTYPVPQGICQCQREEPGSKARGASSPPPLQDSGVVKLGARVLGHRPVPRGPTGWLLG